LLQFSLAHYVEYHQAGGADDNGKRFYAKSANFKSTGSWKYKIFDSYEVIQWYCYIIIE